MIKTKLRIVVISGEKGRWNQGRAHWGLNFYLMMTALNQRIALLYYQSHNSLQFSSFGSDIPSVVKEQKTSI